MKSKTKTAFQAAAEFYIGDAIKSIIDPNHVPYKPPLQKYYIVEALEDHIRHIDAGIGGVSVPVRKGEIIRTQDLSTHSLDMSKFRKVGVIYK